MKVHVEFSTAPAKTARTVQASGLFDVPLDTALRRSWDHELPFEDRLWSVGLIVGPSGSGKSSLAQQLWPDQTSDVPAWGDRALLDEFDAQHSVRDVIGALTAVGLSSTPAWFRPYSTLSNGERFRAEMARRLLSPGDPVVVDEFTSVVDRQVARVASHALQKAVRRNGSRFVAVSCHYDIVEWLQPDWVYDTSSLVFTWRHVQRRPELTLTVHEGSRSDWPLFAPHHYLSSELARAAACFVAYLDGTLCAFTSYMHFPHAHTTNIKMGHRLVVLPDFQGLGIAGALDDWLGQWLHERGFRYRNVVAHPAMIAFYSRSPRWREVTSRRVHVQTGANARPSLARGNMSSRRLLVRSFEYAPKRA